MPLDFKTSRAYKTCIANETAIIIVLNKYLYYCAPGFQKSTENVQVPRCSELSKRLNLRFGSGRRKTKKSFVTPVLGPIYKGLMPRGGDGGGDVVMTWRGVTRRRPHKTVFPRWSPWPDGGAEREIAVSVQHARGWYHSGRGRNLCGVPEADHDHSQPRWNRRGRGGSN